MYRIFLAIGLMAATPLAAQVDAGGVLYRQHCATCHGLEARGGGPMQAVLNVEAPDLTLLAARNGGTFPLIATLDVIDGRTQLTGHGGPMPVFGFALAGESAVVDGPDGAIYETSADILAITQWLLSVQR